MTRKELENLAKGLILGLFFMSILTMSFSGWYTSRQNYNTLKELISTDSIQTERINTIINCHNNLATAVKMAHKMED